MEKIIDLLSWAMVIMFWISCVWYGVVIEIGNKVHLELYPAARFFNKETIHMNGKEYRTYIDSKKVATAKEEDIFHPEV